MTRIGFIWIAILVLSCGSSNDTSPTTEGVIVDLAEKKVALMWLAPDCPLCQAYSTRFTELAAVSALDVSYYGVLPGAHYSQEEIEHFKDSFAFDLEIVTDPDYRLSRKLGATVTPEFFLLDTGYQVIYSGKFDDWATDLSQKKLKPTAYYFKDAIEAFSQGKHVAINHVDPIGCTIEYD